MSHGVGMPIRQAGVHHLKKFILNSWSVEDTTRFQLRDQDRAVIRDALVDAAVEAPQIIRSELCECIGYICKADFPTRWPSLVDDIVIYLQSPDAAGYPGALSGFRVLVKVGNIFSSWN